MALGKDELRELIEGDLFGENEFSLDDLSGSQTGEDEQHVGEDHEDEIQAEVDYESETITDDDSSHIQLSDLFGDESVVPSINDELSPASDSPAFDEAQTEPGFPEMPAVPDVSDLDTDSLIYREEKDIQGLMNQIDQTLGLPPLEEAAETAEEPVEPPAEHPVVKAGERLMSDMELRELQGPIPDIQDVPEIPASRPENMDSPNPVPEPRQPAYDPGQIPFEMDDFNHVSSQSAPSRDQYVQVKPIEFPNLEERITGQNFDLNFFSNIPVKIDVFLGNTTISLKDVYDLTEGSVISLEKIFGEPLELKINGQIIALGDVVSVDKSYGIMIKEIVKHKK